MSAAKKKIGKVQSKRSKTQPQKRNSNKVLYLGIFFTVLSLVLFICAHFLQIIFGRSSTKYWMGIETSSLITDITLYLAIGLLSGMLILWISFHISKEGILKR